MNKRGLGGIIAGAIILLGVILLMMSTVSIKAGYVGVVYSLNGGIKGNVLTQGINLKSPIEKVTQYSVATEQGYLSADKKEGSPGDDSFIIPTADGKTVNVDLEYAYHFDIEKLPITFTKFKGQDGNTIEQTFMRGKLKTWSGEVSSKYSVLDIYGEKRTELNRSVLEHVKKNFEEYGIVIDSIAFSRIGLDQQTEAAIQARVNSQQELEKEKIETEKAKQIAEKTKATAQGVADAAIIQAQGEAKANELLSNSITPQLLSKMEMEARQKFGWVTIQGANSVITDARK